MPVSEVAGRRSSRRGRLSGDTGALLETVLEGQERIEAAQQRMEAHLRWLVRGGCLVEDKTLEVVAAKCSDNAEPVPSAQGSAEAEAEVLHYASLLPGDEADAPVAPMLPKRWPRTLRARRSRHRFGGSTASVSQMLSAAISGRGSVGVDRRSRWRGSVRMPAGGLAPTCAWARRVASGARECFDFLTLVFLAHDLVVVPFSLAWEFSVDIATILTALFWTCDVCMSCCWPQTDDGGTRRHAIKKYLSSWFLLDLPLVCVDWVNIAVTQLLSGPSAARSLGILRLAKTAKALRVLAALKVLRVAKLPRFWSDFVDRNLSENSRILLRLGAVFCGIVWLNHLLACVWFVVGTAQLSDTGSAWTLSVVSVNGRDVTFREAPLTYQYTTAYHWAVAQSTLGAIEISPKNSYERSFNILCSLLALLCGSTLVSVLSATMVDMQVSHQERVRQLRLLRRYLRENEVSSKLAIRVQRQAKARFGDDGKIARADVGAFQLLSESLQKQLHREVCEPKLVLHPFFRMMRNVDVSWFEDFLSTVVQIEVARGDDDIFFAGRTATSAAYLVCGTVSYMQEPRFSPVFDMNTVQVGAGSWLAECALWSEWVHIGSARAVNSCELLNIDAELFLNVFEGHRVVGSIVSEYARCFHLRVHEARPPLGWYPTDLSVPFTDCADVVCLMSRSTRESLAIIAMETARSVAPLSTFLSMAPSPLGGAQKSLQDEVSSGAAALVLKSGGELEAVQHAVQCEVVGEAGRILVQLARWCSGRAVARCQLPEVRQLGGEDAAACWEKVAAARLYPLAGTLTVIGADRAVERLATAMMGCEARKVVRKITVQFEGELRAPLCTTDAPRHPQRWRGLRSSTMFSSVSLASSLVSQRSGDRSVYFVANEAGLDCDDNALAFLYAWLPPDEARHLMSPAGEQEVQAWTATLAPPSPTAMTIPSADDSREFCSGAEGVSGGIEGVSGGCEGHTQGMVAEWA